MGHRLVLKPRPTRPHGCDGRRRPGDQSVSGHAGGGTEVEPHRAAGRARVCTPVAGTAGHDVHGAHDAVLVLGDVPEGQSLRERCQETQEHVAFLVGLPDVDDRDRAEALLREQLMRRRVTQDRDRQLDQRRGEEPVVEQVGQLTFRLQVGVGQLDTAVDQHGALERSEISDPLPESGGRVGQHRAEAPVRERPPIVGLLQITEEPGIGPAHVQTDVRRAGALLLRPRVHVVPRQLHLLQSDRIPIRSTEVLERIEELAVDAGHLSSPLPAEVPVVGGAASGEDPPNDALVTPEGGELATDPVHQSDELRRSTGLEKDLDERLNRTRGPFGLLHQHHVRTRERADQLSTDDLEREVPGGDLADDAERHVPRPLELVQARTRRGTTGEDLAEHPSAEPLPKEVDHQVDLSVGLDVADRELRDHERTHRHTVPLQDVAGLAEDLRPVVDREQAARARVPTTGDLDERLECPIDLDITGTWHNTVEGSAEWTGQSELPLRTLLDPLAADEVAVNQLGVTQVEAPVGQDAAFRDGESANAPKNGHGCKPPL